MAVSKAGIAHIWRSLWVLPTKESIKADGMPSGAQVKAAFDALDDAMILAVTGAKPAFDAAYGRPTTAALFTQFVRAWASERASR